MPNQAEIVGRMARASGISHEKAEQALVAYYGVVAGSLAAGQRVRMPGIGTLSAKPTEAHEARNPRTGDKIIVPAGHKVKFAAALALKDLLALAAPTAAP